MFFHGQNVSIGQRSPMMRIFLFKLFCVIFPVRGGVSIKRPTSKFHYLCFFSDILVVSYVLSCVPST
jgi:hypothetical protein